MSLKDEFNASFDSYVSDDGDLRRMMLEQMLKVPPARLIGEKMLEPHDMAALMTCAVSVDPSPSAASRLLREVEQWQSDRQDAQDNFEDPDQVTFSPTVDGVSYMFDRGLPGLDVFFEGARTIQGGERYLAQVLVCLMWARRIPAMRPNLWNRKE